MLNYYLCREILKLSFEMSIQFIDVKPLWNRRFKKPVYSCIIANLMGDPDPEVIGCSFSAEMKAFDLSGNEVFLTEFDSNIKCFKIASVSKENNTELISGAIDGLVYVMDIKGNQLWSTNLNSPLRCMEIGDLKDDSRAEVLVGLENQQLIGLDNNGEKFLKFRAKEPIIDCSIGYFLEDHVGKIQVLFKSGKVMNVDNEGNSNLVFHLQNQPTCLALCDFYDQSIMIVGDKKGFIKVINSNKEVVGEYDIGTKINCLNCSTISSGQEKKTLLVVASDNSIILLELKKGVLIKRSEADIEIISEKLEPLEQTPVKIVEPSQPSIGEAKIDSPIVEAKPKILEQKVRVLRGGQIKGGEYLFKIKVINDGKYNITNVSIHILSYPEESLILSRVDGHAQASPDRAKFKKISKGGGFVSPSFIFKPTQDCIKGIVHAVVNFINYEDQIETINVEPHEIRMICGLLKAKTVSNEDFETLTNDLLKFNKVGQDFIIPYRADLLFQKLLVLLKTKNFAVVDSEKEESEGKFHGIIKGFAEGSFSKNSVGLKLTLSGNVNEHKSALIVDVYAEDKDMTPHIISEFENAVTPQNCPECEEDLPTELVKKLMEGLPSFCEICGANLLDSNENWNFV